MSTTPTGPAVAAAAPTDGPSGRVTVTVTDRSGVAAPATAGPSFGGMTTATVQLRYFAAAAQAAGVEEETAAADGDLGALLEAAVARHGESLARVLPACSVLVDGVATVDPRTALDAVATVDLLPPFAGG